jgi:hypothetical protein
LNETLTIHPKTTPYPYNRYINTFPIGFTLGVYMTEEPLYKPGDLIFTRNPHALGKLIRFFTRRINEAPTYTNHVAGVGPEAKTVIEALWHVVETPLDQWLKDNPCFEVWRRVGLPDRFRETIAKEAKGYVGRDYGWWKLGLHALDFSLSKFWFTDIYLFRRLMFADRYPICSWVWAYVYSKFNIVFGVKPSMADPDSMHDWVKCDILWTMIDKK